MFYCSLNGQILIHAAEKNFPILLLTLEGVTHDSEHVTMCYRKKTILHTFYVGLFRFQPPLVVGIDQGGWSLVHGPVGVAEWLQEP